jgi:RNA polymerase sigma-70 factor (ECF subfamily)
MTDQSAETDRRLADLMRSAQQGDRAAYERLLRDVTPLVRRAVRGRCPSLAPVDVEDVVQDVLLSLHVVRATYDPTRRFLPWLMAIAHHRTVDGTRRHARRSAHETAVEHLPETFADDGSNTIEGAYGDPEALRSAVKALPQGQRTAVEMLKFRELSLKEASAASGTSVGALKVAVHRAIKTLRQALKAEG